jgi:hypothetical protein
MRASLPLACALAVLAIPAVAQQPDTSASDLRCATWAAVMGGSTDDPAAQQAFQLALSWFTGRYEAATGIRFEEAMTAAYITALQPDLETVDAECRPRMIEYGNRMTKWGADLQRAGSE